MVDSLTKNARATSLVVNPQSRRSARATWVSTLNAG